MWRSVHEERPRASTSGGQSEEAVVVSADAVVDLGGGLVVGVNVEVFIMAFHAAPDVHVRHLHCLS